jgi:hypothetical protein
VLEGSLPSLSHHLTQSHPLRPQLSPASSGTGL